MAPANEDEQKKAGKTFSRNIPSFDPSNVQSGWDSYWEKKGFYHHDFGPNAPRFCMVLPPPNVTGSLHIGHALMASVEDCQTRYKRMTGHNCLWIPGLDHAGIATQTVVERRLWHDEKKTKYDYGRENFVKRVWEWKEKYGGRINNQMRTIGCSIDWDMEAFTMSPELSRAVTEAFVRMYKNGKIYRDNRLVNWSCHLETALSNAEVETMDIEKETFIQVPGYDKRVAFGIMDYFFYEIDLGDGKKEKIKIGTTRLETMLGDTAIAVHPKDKRYAHLVGKKVIHPFIPERSMVVITDEMADPEKGTGAVKITPAHDPHDFECGKRHDLEFINILTTKGLINENGGKFKGMKRYDVRRLLRKELSDLGLFDETDKKNKMTLRTCQRSGDVIEDVMRPQWWVDCNEMAKKSCDAIDNGTITITPKSGVAQFMSFMRKPLPWCISRQLWWGHRIPAWRIVLDGQSPVDDCDEKRWVVARNEEDAMKIAKERYPKQEVSLNQDSDVLDTWFSSGLFPFATLGWPDKTPELEKWFPTQLLETGGDILFFWVARMIMMSYELMGEAPFSKVFLHPMVRDKKGAKMSKSSGNVIDPCYVIDGVKLQVLIDELANGNIPAKNVPKYQKEKKKEFPKGIPACGADALRFGLLSYLGQPSINLDVKVVVGYRHFCNKIWNATKFCLLKLPENYKFPGLQYITDGLKTAPLACKWILSKMNYLETYLDSNMKEMKFGLCAKAIYKFIIDDYCAYFVELVKKGVPTDMTEEQKESEEVAYTRAVLYIVLDRCLKILHPMMPFVSEELWHYLEPRDEDSSIIIQQYPTPIAEWKDDKAVEIIEFLKTLCTGIRSSLQNFNLKPKSKSPAQGALIITNDIVKGVVKELIPLATHMTNTNLEFASEVPESSIASAINADIQFALHFDESVDLKKLVTGFEKKLKKAEKEVVKAEKRYAKLLKQKKTSEEFKANAKITLANEIKIRDSTLSTIGALKQMIEKRIQK